MPKSKKKAAKARADKKSNEQAAAVELAEKGGNQVAKEKPVIRAIRVTKSILDAAKEYNYVAAAVMWRAQQ